MPSLENNENSSKRKKGQHRFTDRFRTVTRFFSNPNLNRPKANRPKPSSLTHSTIISSSFASVESTETNLETQTQLELLSSHEKWKKLSLSAIKQKNKRHRLSALYEVPGKAATISTVRPSSEASSSYWTVSGSIPEMQVTELDDLQGETLSTMDIDCHTFSTIPIEDIFLGTSVTSTQDSTVAGVVVTEARTSTSIPEELRPKRRVPLLDPAAFSAHYDSFAEYPPTGNSISDNYSIFGSSMDLDHEKSQTSQFETTSETTHRTSDVGSVRERFLMILETTDCYHSERTILHSRRYGKGPKAQKTYSKDSSRGVHLPILRLKESLRYLKITALERTLRSG
ncbi:hypothetical protein FGIG_09139 [Fasciola gigantica]|uniref:Uncharacterized protein n=1 Tax=Fasciola gigantica TaxID=46835 RepID=A0A504Z2B2_FASGI|nr:hypothetical protein FGIG_09139 [Fasciola gigantica]